MPWQNQHLSDQIKMVDITKVRYPITPLAIVTNNQKMDIPPEDLFLKGEGETSKAITGTTELNSVSCGGKNVKNFIASILKNYYTVWQKNISDRAILGIIKNGLKLNFKERPGITPAPKIPHSEQEI